MMQWSKRYDCNEQQVVKNVPEAAGVYLLIQGDDKTHPVFYAGQTDNLKQGLLGQVNGDANTCVRKHLKVNECFFRFAEVSQATERKQLAQKMVADYGPDCNKADN